MLKKCLPTAWVCSKGEQEVSVGLCTPGGGDRVWVRTCVPVGAGLWVCNARCGQACTPPHSQNFLAGPGGGAGFLSHSICVTGVGSLSNCDNEEDGGC